MRFSRIRHGQAGTYIHPVGAAQKKSGQAGRFLAERYLSAATPQALSACVDDARAAARAVSIRHIQTIYVPADETCFTLFEATSPDLVTQANEHFGLGYGRVMPAITFQSQECDRSCCQCWGASPSGGASIRSDQKDQPPIRYFKHAHNPAKECNGIT
jgi:hypothetical protein